MTVFVLHSRQAFQSWGLLVASAMRKALQATIRIFVVETKSDTSQSQMLGKGAKYPLITL